jgi:hypothetical protein
MAGSIRITNLAEVLAGFEATEDNIERAAQYAITITGLAVDILPASNVEQNYKFATRRYAGGEPSTSDMTLTMEFEVNLNDANSMSTYKILRQWSDLIYNPLTGAMGLKTDYVGSLVISIFNKRGDVFRRIRVPSCFLSEAINAMELDYENPAIYTVSTSWICDYWEDLFL